MRDWKTILRHRLGPADYFLALDEMSYVVVMPAGEPRDSQISCLRIAYELHASLLGPLDVGQVRISRAVSLQGGELLREPIAMTEMLQLTKRAGLHEFLGDQRGRYAKLGSDVEWSRSPRGNSQPRHETEVHYTPLWDARREAVTTYRCSAAHGSLGHEAPPSQEKLKDELARTIGALYAAGGELARHVDRGERFLVDIPIHFEVLSAPFGRMDLAVACRSLPSEYRPYLVFEITNLPAGVPHSRLNDLVTAIKPFGKAVMAHVPLRCANYATYQGAGVNAIGFDFSRSGFGATEMMAEIDRLAAGSKRLSMLSFVLDVADPKVLAHACRAGVNLISAPLVGAAARAPSSMLRLTRSVVNARIQNLVHA